MEEMVRLTLFVVYMMFVGSKKETIEEREYKEEKFGKTSVDGASWIKLIIHCAVIYTIFMYGME